MTTRLFPHLLAAMLLTTFYLSAADLVWQTDLEAGLKQARELERPVLIGFGATWCRYCRLMDEVTLADPAVRRLLDRVVRVKVDLDRQPQVAARYGVHSLPTFLLVDAGGAALARLAGYQEAPAMRAWLEAPRDIQTGPPPAAIGKAWLDLPPDQQVTWIPELVATVAHAGDGLASRDEERFLADQAAVRPGAFVDYLDHPSLAFRIVAANLLAARLDAEIGYDPWAAPAERQSAIARLRQSLSAK